MSAENRSLARAASDPLLALPRKQWTFLPAEPREPELDQETQILTLTGVPQYVETGLAVGIDRWGERPQIVVNVEASRAEGSAFTAQLLKLARIVKQ